jgi:hypothetical protein
MSTPFKMKGSPAKLGTIQGTSGHASALKKAAAFKDEEERKKFINPEKQDIIDKKIIEEYQDPDKPGGYGAISGTEEQVKKSLRRQTVRDSYNLSRKELKEILKQQEQTGSFRKGSSKKGGWLHRTFGSTEDLRGVVTGRALQELRTKDIRGQASDTPYEEGYDVTPE